MLPESWPRPERFPSFTHMCCITLISHTLIFLKLMFPLLVKQVCLLMGILKASWMEGISSCAQQHSCSVAANSEAFFLMGVCHDKHFPDPPIWKWTCEVKILLSTSAKLTNCALSYHLRVFKGELLNCGDNLLSVSVGALRGMFVVGIFLVLEINCSVCGIQWTNHFQCPALLLLLLSLSRLSPSHSAVVYLALVWRLVLPALLSQFNCFSSCWDNTILCCTSDTTN